MQREKLLLLYPYPVIRKKNNENLIEIKIFSLSLKYHKIIIF